MKETVSSAGMVNIVIEWDDGSRKERFVRNKILKSGRESLAKTLANEFGGTFQYFVNGISFGSGGTLSGTPRVIDDTRSGLFGPTVITKPVISTIDPTLLTKITFTSVLTFDEVVGSVINEIALKLSSGDFFSMATFGDITKTSTMQTTFNWSISLV